MKQFLLSILFLVFVCGSKGQVLYNPNFGNFTISLACGVTHTFTDNNPAANYSTNQQYTVTFVPATAGQCIRLNFTTFNIHNSDLLSIWDGPTTAAPSLGNYNGNGLTNVGAPLPVITSTSGALTFVFTSDGSNQLAGWIALIQCTP